MAEAPAAAKEQAIAQVLQIMAANDLDAGDIRAALKHAKRKDSGDESERRAPLGHMVLKVFYYLGGTLMFAGLGIYINTEWEHLVRFQRVLVTLGPGFVAYLMGVIFARNEHLEKAATPAHMLAFLMQPLGILVLLKEYGHGGSEALAAMIAFGPLAVQQALTFTALKRPSLLLFALLYFYGFAGAATVYFDIDRGISALACGTFLFFATVDMQRRKAYRDLTPLFFVLGSALMLAGLYYHIGRTIFDPLALSLCLAFLMHAVLSESKMLFFVSLLYVFMYFCGGPGGGWGSWSWSDANWRFNHEMAAIFSGSSLVLAGYWLNRSPFISAPPVWLFVGTEFVLGGFYSMLYETASEPLFAGVATLAIYAALLMRSRAMLAASILSLLGFICAYAEQHFAKNADWPLLLILFGFIILLSGFVFARLSAKIKENPVPKT